MSNPEPVPAGQHAAPADFGALGYGPGEYGQHAPPAEAVTAEARQAAVNAAAAYEPEAFSVYAGNPKYFLSAMLETARRALEAAAPLIAEQAAQAQRAADEAEFAARMDTWQQAMAATVRKATEQARADERKVIVQQLAKFRFHDECKRGDDCPNVWHCGLTLPLPGGVIEAGQI